MRIEELDQMIRGVCPIDGINSNGVIWFKNEATDQQKQDAQALMDQHLSEIDK